MSAAQEIQACLLSLGVGELGEEWTAGVWEDDFCESVSLPSQVEASALSVEKWERLVDACGHWLMSQEEKGEGDDDEEEEGISPGLWTALLDASISYRSLMALIYCVLERSKITAVDKVCAIHSARLYLVLLQIPGSSAFKIFHSMVFQKALDTFYLYPDEETSQLTRPSGRGGRRGRGGRGRGRKRQRPQFDEEESERGGGGGGGGVQLCGGDEVENVRVLLKQLIEELHSFLSTFPLLGHEAGRYQVLQTMVMMTKAEIGSTSASGMEFSGPGMGLYSDGPPLCVSAWRCLQNLCKPLHGEVEKTVMEVFRHLLSVLLMLTADGGVFTGSSLPSSLTAHALHALAFVSFISGEYGSVVISPLKALVQHLSTKVPDRADYRHRIAGFVTKLLSLFPDSLYSQMLEWIYKYSRNTKIGYRVFALDVVTELLTQPMRTPEPESISGEEEYRLSYRFLLKMIVSRCSDKAPSVRGRALSALAMAASSQRSGVSEAVRWCIASITSSDPVIAATQGIPCEGVIVPMVHRRVVDEKVGVRKAALQALEAIVRMNMDNIRNEDAVVIHDRCLDPSLSVRKQALSSLTSLMLEKPQHRKLQSLWLEGVLPMVMDRESGAQEKCMTLLEEVILNNIAPLNRSTNEIHGLVWHLLSLVASEERLDLRRCLHKALEGWSKQDRLSDSVVRAVVSHTDCKEHLQPAWMLLAELSQFTKCIGAKFIIDSWRQYNSATETPSPLVQILITIGNMTRPLGKIAIEDIKDQILGLLQSFKLSAGVIQAAVNTLCQICTALTTVKTYQSVLDSWCRPLLKSCEQYLSAVIMKSTDSGSPVPFSESEAICHIFTLGEVSLLSPSHTSTHLCLMMQTLLIASSECQSMEASKESLPSSSQLSGLGELSLSPSLRAYAYVTLGKLCLQNDELAKKSIVLLVQELEHSQHPAIRNNIIVILCDLAVRYSAKIDPYISNISSCLCDDSLLVRKQTLTLLAHLLQEDFIKWKGSLFFRFVTTLVDEELKKFSEFCLVHLLLSRQPTVFFHNFVECVFHFNGYEHHRVYNKFRQTEREKRLFSLKGPDNAGKRLTIYTFLLSHMTDEQRFQLTAKLSQEVLGGVVDEVIQLNDDGIPIIKDTLAILVSKEIKLSSLRRNMGEELADEGDEMGAAVATAQTRIISQIVKRNVIENIVPIVVSVKHLFEQQHSPLLKDLLLCLKELMQDYRSEINEVLGADQQLAEEIEFDLKRFEEEQKKAAKVQTPLQPTPHAQMISPLLSPAALGSPGALGGSIFTPPRLRGHTPKSKIPTARATPFLKTKTPVRLGMSPLVTAARLPRSRPAPDDAIPHTPYVTRIRTPAIPLKTASIPLQRAVLLSTARKAGRQKVLATPAPAGDVTMLPGRAASTPEGMAESISFNVSSVVQPSPIPPSTTLDSYTTRRSTRSQSKTKGGGRGGEEGC